jgi:hypothetical protein
MRKHYSYTENEMGEKPTDKKVSICIIQRIKNYLNKLNWFSPGGTTTKPK